VYTYECPVFDRGAPSRVQEKVAVDGNTTTLNVTCSPKGMLTSFVFGVFDTMQPLSRAAIVIKVKNVKAFRIRHLLPLWSHGNTAYYNNSPQLICKGMMNKRKGPRFHRSLPFFMNYLYD
jgi:hypothetical protein